jgi:tetratricopeptide (TPR) repeat protein
VSDANIMTRLSFFVRSHWHKYTGQLHPSTSRVADFHLRYLRARALARTGAFDMAVLMYKQAIDLEPNLVEAWEGLGEALDVIGKPQLAMEKYASARRIRAEMRPGAPDRHFVLRQRGHFMAEILAYDSVLRSLKKNALPYVARGNAYLASGQPENALKNYDYALELKGNLPGVAALKGEALSKLGRYDEALRWFDVATAARPNDAEALGGRAISRLGLGLLEEANADWQRQFFLLEGYASARACVALRMADWALALPELERAIAKEPNDPYWHLYRLTTMRRLGMPIDVEGVPSIGIWPGTLLDLHVGRTTPDEVLGRAETEGRRAEALFQLGVQNVDQDRQLAVMYWKKVIERSPPSLIEHAAARNELARCSP